MHLKKKQRSKPLYKKLLPLKKNIQDRNKFVKFKKKKWQRFQYSILRFKKKKFYDSTSYSLFKFKNFFNKKFKYNLHNKQRLKFAYGTLRKNYLKKSVKSTLKEFKNKGTYATFLFIKRLETRLDTALYRAHFSYSFRHARQLISHKKVYVNNKIVQYNSYSLKKGDLITLSKDIFDLVILNILKIRVKSIPPKHFHINYKTLQILIIEDINYTNCLTYYSFWMDFNSFLQFYEK